MTLTTSPPAAAQAERALAGDAAHAAAPFSSQAGCRAMRAATLICAIVAGVVTALLPPVAEAACAYGPEQCQPGFVWRDAFPGDKVCVTGDVRTQAAQDNAQAAQRRVPNGAYGPNTCVQGYVWREAGPNDQVCVTGAVRSQAAADNAQALNRRDPACAVAVAPAPSPGPAVLATPNKLLRPIAPNRINPGAIAAPPPPPATNLPPPPPGTVSTAPPPPPPGSGTAAPPPPPPGSGSAAPPPPPAPAPTWPIQVGIGINDITGPAAEVVMMGYANSDQSTTGLHMRLYARAFIFHSPQTGKRVVFVTADLGQLFSSIKQGVLRELANRYGGLYNETNVQIAATHTHAGPGGYSHHAIYNFTSNGFVRQNYINIVDGIVAAIHQAHARVGQATLSLAAGNIVAPASKNRSPEAFMRNPETRGPNPPPDVNPEMTLLRIDGPQGPAGSIAWFSVHNTTLSRNNRLISGDHKGFSSYEFERMRGSIPPFVRPGEFVAAFPSGDVGDLSPNLGPNFTGVTGEEFSSLRTIGMRQLNTALGLFNGSRSPVVGEIDYRHTFALMPGFAVTNTPHRNGAGGQTLCTAAFGASFAAGAEDGRSGAPAFREGMAIGGNVSANDIATLRGSFGANSVPAWLRTAFMGVAQAANDPCQHPKPVLIPTGALGWTPEILPFQLLRVGPVVIAGIPGEMTVQASRRLRDRIQSALARRGVNRVILTGLANEYSGYITTLEEYDSQQYEGASTMFGRLTFEAYLQIFGQLADAMAAGQPVPAGPTPPDLGGRQIELQTGVVYDDKRVFEQFGQVMTQPPLTVPRNRTVQATFRAGHPKNDLKRNDTYLLIERNTGGHNWERVAWDAMPETRYIWRRDTAVDCLACSFVDVQWDIPGNATPGTYRIRHFGVWKNGTNGALTPYQGTTRTFTVQ